MFLHLCAIISLIHSLSGKPTIVRSVSDCTIIDEGILHYHGKHSYTNFDNECLPWNDLQTDYVDIINEPNFFNDVSIKAAKNYCRNPNMNLNGPWCFVQNEGVITMEQCDVCQSLTSRISNPIEAGSINDIMTEDVKNNFLQQFQDEIKRYATYIRDKIKEIIARMKTSFKKMTS